MQEWMKIAIYGSAVAFIVFPILLLQMLKVIKQQKSVVLVTIILVCCAIFIAYLIYVRFSMLAYTSDRSRNWLLTFYGTSALLICSPLILINGTKRILGKEAVPELYIHNFYLGVTGLFCWLIIMID